MDMACFSSAGTNAVGSHGSGVEAKLASPALKVGENAVFKELFIGLLSGFNVSLAELEHAIEQAGELVGSGVDGRWGSKTRFKCVG